MSIIKILQYPDPRLKRVSVPVEIFDDSIQKVIDDMFETNYATPNCAALAATQLDLDIPWRISVIDLHEASNGPVCLVNPKIIHRQGEQHEFEGCMSVYPSYVHEKVKRAMTIEVEAQDRYGNPLNFSAEGYFAKCIQHEVDHLDGNIFLDHLHKIIVERVKRKIKQYERTIKNQQALEKKKKEK